MPRTKSAGAIAKKAPKAAKSAKAVKSTKKPVACKSAAKKTVKLPEVKPAEPVVAIEAAPAKCDATTSRRCLSQKVLKLIDSKLGRRASQVRIGKVRQEIADLLLKLDEMLQRKASKPNDHRILKRFSTEELLAAIQARQE